MITVQPGDYPCRRPFSCKAGATAHTTIGEYMKRLIAEGYQGPLALPEAGR
jgi:hypothetical protein